jgi:hypothetical protein
MTRVSAAVLALLCVAAAQTARAIPSQPTAHTPSAVDGDRFNDLDTRDDHQWGSSFNHTEWGLTEDDLNFVEEEDFDTDNSTTLLDDEHELDARGKKVKKVGLAFDWFSPVNPGAWKSSNIRAVYNWDIWKPTNMPKGVPYWPMLHRQEKTKDWLTVCKKGYANVALGMNEPDHPNQANMSPKQAAAIWRKYMLPLRKRGYNLISPAVTSAPSGLKWLKAWKKECPSCWKSINGGVALHYYGKSATGFKNYMNKAHKELGKPIHITETACEDFTGNKCSAKQAADYMNSVTSWAMKTSWVRSIFYFGMWPKDKMPGAVGAGNSLVDSSGRPTALGKKFISY